MFTKYVRAGLSLAVGALLAACSDGTEAALPTNPTADEQSAIEDASEMLDERPDATTAPSTDIGNE